MPLTLTSIPGFADLPDDSLLADSPALGLYLAKIAENAAFGMVRMEIFTGSYKHGDTVGLPVSDVDGYNYSRSELLYTWAVQTTVNPSTGWLSGDDTLWYGDWKVDQNTGAVSTLEYYRRSGSHANPTQSNDGTLTVFTIAQRQRTTLLVESLLNSYTDISDGTFATDAPLNQSLIQALNDGAKMSGLSGECFYMGEFSNGDTISLSAGTLKAKSLADGYQYTFAETTFQASWRGTTPISGGVLQQPDMAAGQLAPISWSINASTGAVTVTVQMVDNGGSLITASGFGRIAVWAFCSRSNLLSGISAANAFSEIDVNSIFPPGNDLRASTALQLIKNIREALSTPEFFGPTEYATGSTIPLPTSSIDGYTYSRAECRYLYEWSDTTPASGSHLRTAEWTATVSQTTGAVTLQVGRLADGGPIVMGPESGQHMRIRVVTVGLRGAHTQSVVGASSSAPGDVGSIVTDNDPPDTAIYAIPVDIGDISTPRANQSLLRHIVSDLVNSVTADATTSKIKCRVTSTGTYIITLTKNGSSIGTITFSSGNATAALSFTASFAGFDEIDFVGQATPDATLAGIYGTISCTRT